MFLRPTLKTAPAGVPTPTGAPLTPPRPHRPVLSGAIDPADPGADPARQVELAHDTAWAVLRAARTGGEAPVDLVERLGGLDELTALWRHAEPGTLPSSLLTLHVLRAWCRAQGAEAARLYRAGLRRAEVSHVVAGVVEPPGPQDIADLADAVLTSTYRDDLAIALERAAAFCAVIGAGREADAHDRAGDDPDEATRQLRLATGNARAARDLGRAAAAWRAGALQ
jgi:hypothetical protein